MSRQVDVKSLISHLVRGDGIDKCRICMGDTSEGQVFLEDTVLIDSEQPVTLSELLFTITGVQLIDESYLPVGVCVSCVTSTIAAYELRTLVNQSQKIWNNSIKAFDRLPQPNHVEKPIICYVENDKIRTEYFKKETPKTERPKVDVPLKLRKNIFKKERKTRTTRNGPSCECVDCGKKFSDPYYLNIHLKNSSQKEACQFCGNIFFRGDDLQNHMLIIHGRFFIKCPECPVLLESEKEAAEHRKLAHTPGALTCYCCGRTFSRQSALDSHSQMHEVRTCRKCERQFTNRVCYREHRSQCEPEAKPIAKSRSQRSNVRDPATYICDYCNKSYKSRPQLKNHILWIHMNHRPFQCTLCGKRFYTSARLTEHGVVHTRERNFSCDICQAKLVTKMAMIYHKRRHTGEKPYECEDCGEKFLSASRRTEHAKRKHKKGKRFQCEFCPMNFPKGIELRKHKDKYHATELLALVKTESIVS